MADDTTTIGPGLHEDAALDALGQDRADQAQVRAILALAAAVNRLAEAHERLAEAHED